MKTTILFFAAVSTLGTGLLISAPHSREAKPEPSNQTNVGQTIKALSAVSLAGDSVKVPFPAAKATVIALSSVTCPLCQKYEPTLATLEDNYAKKGIKFVFVNPSSVESAGEMTQLVKRLKLDGPYIHDPKGRWTKALGAKTTTETFVLDESGKLVYRGAIDDQYAIGAALPKPKNRYLADALDAVLIGKPVKVKSTSAPGCLLNEEPMEVAESIPTFHGKIQHIVQRSCMPCHREGGIAPFSLDGYDAVKSRAKMLEFVVDEGIMPPWFAKQGGPWRNDISLPEADKAALKAWIAGGTPKGNPKDAPTPVVYASGWNIGKPDAEFKLPEPVKIKESGVMSYVNINVPTNFTEDKWVEKIEVVPGDRRAVHHVLVFVRSQETANLSRREQIVDSDARDELSGFFGIYVPGNSTLTYPKGLAKRIPKGAVLRFQLHYTPYGQASTDQTKIGFVFAKEPPKSEVHTASVANLRFAIPPRADNHKVEAQVRVPTDIQLLSFLPHMHVRAKAARYELEVSGKTTPLLDVPRYDFNWQLNYVLKAPLNVKAGDTVHYDAWYDNSENNPANPDPTKTVRWGSQTFDEMHLGYIEYIIPGEKPGEGGQGLRRRPGGGAGGTGGPGVAATFRRLDRNSDGFVTEEEAGVLWNRIKDADANGDGKLTLEEATKFFGGGRGR
jgi:thiol-disulfide isomerase/thioredoxin